MSGDEEWSKSCSKQEAFRTSRTNRSRTIRRTKDNTTKKKSRGSLHNLWSTSSLDINHQRFSTCLWLHPSWQTQPVSCSVWPPDDPPRTLPEVTPALNAAYLGGLEGSVVERPLWGTPGCCGVPLTSRMDFLRGSNSPGSDMMADTWWKIKRRQS